MGGEGRKARLWRLVAVCGGGGGGGGAGRREEEGRDGEEERGSVRGKGRQGKSESAVGDVWPLVLR